MRPDGNVGRGDAPVRRRQDADDVGPAARRSLEVHRQGGDTGEGKRAGVHVAPVEGLLDLGEGEPAAREEPVAGLPVNGDGKDALTARGGYVEAVGRELPCPLRTRDR